MLNGRRSGSDGCRLSLAVVVPKISDTDKATVRENLMEAIVQAPSIIR